MTSTEKPSVNLYEPRAVSRERFRIEDAAGVAIELSQRRGSPQDTVGTFVGRLAKIPG